MPRVALVAVGGLVGAVLRYVVGGFAQAASGSTFPVGTLAVNALGSFCLGVVVPLSLERGLLGPEARLFLGVGLLGSFTTMSTFSVETLLLLREGSFLAAGLNVGGTLAAALGGAWLGFVAASLL